jgi:hypothetical protein
MVHYDYDAIRASTLGLKIYDTIDKATAKFGFGKYLDNSIKTNHHGIQTMTYKDHGGAYYFVVPMMDYGPYSDKRVLESDALKDLGRETEGKDDADISIELEQLVVNFGNTLTYKFLEDNKQEFPGSSLLILERIGTIVNCHGI